MSLVAPAEIGPSLLEDEQPGWSGVVGLNWGIHQGHVLAVQDVVEASLTRKARHFLSQRESSSFLPVPGLRAFQPPPKAAVRTDVKVRRERGTHDQT